MTPADSLEGKIILLTILSVGLTLIGLSVRAIMKSKKASGWPVAEGSVIQSRMITNFGSDSGVTYDAWIVYRYTVNGVEYTSTRISYGPLFSTTRKKRKISALVRKYRESGKAKVYYNPDKAKESVLKPEVLSELYWQLAIGTIIILFVALFFI
jgi:hypothetical protein